MRKLLIATLVLMFSSPVLAEPKHDPMCYALSDLASNYAEERQNGVSRLTLIKEIPEITVDVPPQHMEAFTGLATSVINGAFVTPIQASKQDKLNAITAYRNQVLSGCINP